MFTLRKEIIRPENEEFWVKKVKILMILDVLLFFQSGLISGERTPLLVYGLAKIHKTKLLATLSGLKLEAEMNAVHSSLTFKLVNLMLSFKVTFIIC